MEKKTLVRAAEACSILAVLFALLVFVFRKTYTVSN